MNRLTESFGVSKTMREPALTYPANMRFWTSSKVGPRLICWVEKPAPQLCENNIIGVLRARYDSKTVKRTPRETVGLHLHHSKPISYRVQPSRGVSSSRDECDRELRQREKKSFTNDWEHGPPLLRGRDYYALERNSSSRKTIHSLLLRGEGGQ